MRKPDFCICENKDADQLRGYPKADQHLCFRYIDKYFILLSPVQYKLRHDNCTHSKAHKTILHKNTPTMPILPKSEISRLQPSSVAAQPGLCQSWLETPKTGFLTTRLKLQISI